MDDGDPELSNHDLFSSVNVGDGNSSMDSFFDELLRDTHACTHTHTCNPPGPDFSHTHTCFHVHTKIVPGSSEGKISNDETSESTENKSKKRPTGNREAVRKYREKKKARAASLEDEVVKLRALNQQLLKRLQGEAVLEAEIARLKCLLVDIRGRIEGEIGPFPYQKSAHNLSAAGSNLLSSCVVDPCNIQCNDQLNCLHSGEIGRCVDSLELEKRTYSGGCEFDNQRCLASQNSESKIASSCGGKEGAPNGDTSGRGWKKG